MWPTWLLATSAAGVYVLYRLFRKLLEARSDVIQQLPGPQSKSWVFGCVREYILGEFGPQMWKWQNEFGMVYRLPAEFGSSTLMLSDPVAIGFILSDHFTFMHTPSDTEVLRSVLGEGLTWSEGATHTRQRSALQPSFSPAFIKNLYPLFCDKVRILVETLHEYRLTENGESAPVNMIPWMNRVALDIIGTAAFRYDFNSLLDESNKVANSFTRLMNESLERSDSSILTWAILGRLPPAILRNIDRLPTDSSRQISEHRKLMTETAKTLVDRSLREIEDGVFEQGRDILSQLVLANQSSEPEKRLTDYEVYSQVMTMLAAGEETVATTTVWGLYELAVNPIHQERMRAEIEKAVVEAGVDQREHLPLAALEKLEYTNAFIKETLRMHPGLYSAPRSVAKDTIIPLAQPVRLLNGQTVTSISVKKGQDIDCVTNCYNRLVDVWGEDADVFDPTRWIEQRMGTLKPFPTTYANIMTFLGGPRSCIGWRFAMMELQLILVELIRNFHFALPPDIKIQKQLAAIPVPVVVEGDVSKVKTVKGMGKSNLPLVLTPVASE